MRERNTKTETSQLRVMTLSREKNQRLQRGGGANAKNKERSQLANAKNHHRRIND